MADKEQVEKIQAEIAWIENERKGYQKTSPAYARLTKTLKEAKERLKQAKKK